MIYQMKHNTKLGKISRTKKIRYGNDSAQAYDYVFRNLHFYTPIKS